VSATAVGAPDYAGAPGNGLPSRLRGWWRGPSRDPAWARPALFALLAVTGLLYLFGLSRNGYANDFYAAAVQAGTKSWKAFFFGSFDAANFITVDKTPASLWVDEIFGRVFGFSTWTLLGPQALEGIGAVWLLFLAVRRWFGPGAGLVAGLAFALTPAAALIFRFNNPDALLTLLMTASAYCVQRSVERTRGALRWLLLAGLLLGFAFLAKMAQAFLVLPGFALGYLVAGPVRLPRRIWHLLAAGAAVIAGAGWWIVIAQLWPAGSRPYFGGSTNNNILELALGYNGLGRLDGTETGSIGFNGSSAGGAGRFAGGGGGGNTGGATGILRLFQSEFGGQVSWLLPAALIALAALLWVARPRRSAVDAAGGAAAADTGAGAAGAAAGGTAVTRMRAFAAIWGGWLLVTGLVFSFMQGIIHPYYMVALAPATGALVGVGAISLWQARIGWAGRGTAAVAVGVTAWWSVELLDRTPDWLPWLRWVVLAAGAAGVLALLGAGALRRLRGSAATAVAAGAALVAGLAGPLGYTLDTVNSAHTGAIPSAGPAVTGAFGGRGGLGGTPAGGFAGGRAGAGAGGRFPGRGTGGGFGGGGAGPGTGGGFGGAGNGNGSGTGGASGLPRTGTGGPGAGGFGGLSGNTTVSAALVKLLEQDSGKYRWIAATEGTEEAAPIELATGGLAVVAIGGFNGTDPAPTLAQFESMAARDEIHYYVGTGTNSFGGGSGSSAITSWVAAHYTAQTVGGSTVYNLTRPKS
jgi:4-amino-4-deoxy-L-arabinose transferase-like glycosyltransferase